MYNLVQLCVYHLKYIFDKFFDQKIIEKGSAHLKFFGNFAL